MVDPRWAEGLGWAATVVFVGSYFGRGASSLRRLQMAGAALWMVYGVVLHAAPVVVANVLVLAAAGWSELRAGRERARLAGPGAPGA
jgi:hypothetical protein